MRRLSCSAIAAVLGLATLSATAIPNLAQANVSIGVSVDFAPPPLPIYEQPPIPGPDYIWMPGYWAWGDDDYYWVPGTWVLAPEPGLLWTPAWWGWDNGAYLFHSGYWGPEVGFYGGIAYGFGYTGFGYEGGYWDHDRFFYNRTVNNINNVNITNVYNRTVNNTTITRVSYNGPGGVTARPTSQQLLVQRQHHLAPTPLQLQHQQIAARDPVLHAAANHGAPPIAATLRPAVLRGPGVVPAARAGGVYNPPMRRADQAGRPIAGAMAGRQAAPFAQQPRTAFNNAERAAPAAVNQPNKRPAPYANARPTPSDDRQAPDISAREAPSPVYSRPAPQTDPRYAHAETYNRPYVDSRSAAEYRPPAEYRAPTPQFHASPSEARAYRAPPAEYRAPAPQYRAPPPEARAYHAPPAEYRTPPQQRAQARPAPPAEKRKPDPGQR